MSCFVIKQDSDKIPNDSSSETEGTEMKRRRPIEGGKTFVDKLNNMLSTARHTTALYCAIWAYHRNSCFTSIPWMP